MEGGFLTPRKSNAASLVAVIALHGAALTALALSKMDMPIKEFIPRLTVENIPIPPDPPKVIPEQQPQKQKATAPSELQAIKPPMDLPNNSSVEGKTNPDPTPPIGAMPGEKVVLPEDKGPVVLPPPAPVRVAAQIDPRYADALQPPYPPSEQRMSNEGKVSVRVTIGTDGRVKAVRKISATSDAFYKATERQALTRWRFKPAAVDGKAVESEKVMTVTFQMER
ncbi:TonB family protein [Allosphingosinicella flava]|uniref:Protein TonB n=1 Tax=Allosphingosinicella flava TaxID=2771430 RepID=A0A7T2LM44_9SPHN|nr:energy transducer TonB [Sphingosinicella flava]QPQ54682.1 TonB family protein [Sphingosinicella flava]